MIVEHLHNILSQDFNKNIIEELKNIPCWEISPDQNSRDNGNLSDKFSDSGMLINSYNQDFNIPKDQSEEIKYSFLNVSANHIFRSVLNNSSFIFYNVFLKRYLWNYYNRSSSGVSHQDSKSENAYSIVYYLDNSDGGTFIGDDFYKSISNDAIIFKSNTLHRGLGPTLSKNRFLLNITFTADKYERK